MSLPFINCSSLLKSLAMCIIYIKEFLNIQDNSMAASIDLMLWKLQKALFCLVLFAHISVIYL